MQRRLPAVLSFIALCALAPTATIEAAPVEIVRVWLEHQLARDRMRLGEIVSGEGPADDPFIYRSKDDSRDGLYFTIRINRGRKVRSAQHTLRLSVIPPDTDVPREITMPIPSSRKRGVRLEIGLTGTDWTYGEALPLAWRVEVVDAEGKVVAEEKSFLWEKPVRTKS